MSDYSISIVPKKTEYPNHEEKAREILEWLIEMDIVKPEKSDLDLQILYDLTPFKINIDEWTDMHLKDALSQEIKSWIFRLSVQQKISIDGVSQGSTLYKKLKQDASITVGKTYPYLYQTFFNKKDFTAALAAPNGRQLKMNIIRLEKCYLI